MTSEENPTFEIILGTYEEFTIGYKVNGAPDKFSLVQTFATHDHTSSVRSLATGGHFLASGGADDKIFIYDMNTRREHTVLTHHSGTVTSLGFSPDESHLLSGSEDGNVYVIRTGSWQVEKIWTKAHNGNAINMVAVHPSGKLAFTLGNDVLLKTWNLVKGRHAFVVRLQPHIRGARTVSWCPTGTKFVIFSNRNIEIWDIEKGGCIHKAERKSSISSVCCISKYIIVGHEDGSIAVLNSKLNEQCEVKSHKARIKCLSSEKPWIVSADSTGKIILWSFHKGNMNETCSVSSGCRITCMVLFTNKNVKEETSETNQIEETNQNENEENSDEDADVTDNVKVVKIIDKRKRSTAFIVEEREDESTPLLKKQRTIEKKKKVKKQNRKNRNKNN